MLVYLTYVKFIRPRFHIYVDQTPQGEKDFSMSDDLDGSEPKVGFTSPDFPIPRYFTGKLKDLRYYPSAVYKDLADRGRQTYAFDLKRMTLHCVL